MDDVDKVERLEKELAEVHEALVSRGDIGIAKGLLMQRYALTDDEAFELLARLSSTKNIKLRDVAAELIRTRVFPTDSPERPTAGGLAGESG